MQRRTTGNRRRRSKRPVQHRFSFPNKWGGRRKGSGRKPVGHCAMVRHARRAEVKARDVQLVTVRIVPVLRSLRERTCLRLLNETLRGQLEREGFRVVHLSVQFDHAHFLIEAESKGALSSGMNGLLSSWARRINRHWNRVGRLWHGRYHVVPKRTPSEVRHALRYVFTNGIKHWETPKGQLDPACSVEGFENMASEIENGPGLIDLGALSRPSTWMLSLGWRRAGPLTPKLLGERP